MNMTQECGLKLLDISANLASSAIQAKAVANNASMSESELKDLFSVCVEMVFNKFEASPCSQDINEKFATIGEMHKVFADKIVEIERKDEKFATISEMHRIFAEKFTEVDRKLAALPYSNRTSRRPV